jgi:hypothetical protein
MLETAQTYQYGVRIESRFRTLDRTLGTGLVAKTSSGNRAIVTRAHETAIHDGI